MPEEHFHQLAGSHKGMSMQSCSVNGLPQPLKIGSKLLRNGERFHDCWIRSSLSEVEIFLAKSPDHGVGSSGRERRSTPRANS